MREKKKKDASRGLRLSMLLKHLNYKTPYGGVTVKELGEKFGITERQVHRDLRAIQDEFKEPLVKRERDMEGKKCVFYALEAGHLPSIAPEKATALFLSLLQQQGSALAGHINEFKDVLVSTLFKFHYNPRELAMDKLQNRIHMVEEALAEPGAVGKVFAVVVGALKDCHRIKLWYYTAHSGEITKRVVEPYGLICKRQNWYLVAYCRERHDIRVFRVDQIKDVLAYTGEKFTYPADFDLRQYMLSSWGVINDGRECRVRIKFSPQVAHRIKNMIYHPSQSLDEEPANGSVVVSFNVCGIGEMKTWIIQWGDNAEVLEPDWLREEMKKMAEDIANLYRRGSWSGH